MSLAVDALDELPVGTFVDRLRRLGGSPPWLHAAADEEAVRAALTRRVPELASGTLILRECEVDKVRVNRDSLTARYRLTVESPDAEKKVLELDGEILPPGQAEPEAGSQNGPIGTDGWRCYVPELRVALRTKPTDAALPVLPQLTEPEAARRLLESGIRAGSSTYADLCIQACTPNVVRYKPGSRCTVLYRLEFPPEHEGRGWPNPVIAKTHHGAKGRNAYDAMRALWSSSLRSGSAVTIAEPLAYLPRENVVLQGPVPGEHTLKDLIESALSTGEPDAVDELSRYIGKTGIGLAELHTCGVSSGELVTWDGELAELEGRIARLGELEPEVAGATRSLLRRLEARATDHPAGLPGPAHRSFRPAQVLLHEGEIGFIDFDGFCQAEPALDLALFRAILKDVGLRSLRGDGDATAKVEHLGEVFLAGYEAVAPVSRERVALWEALDLLSLVVNCWKKVKPKRLEHRLELLSHHLESSGL